MFINTVFAASDKTEVATEGLAEFFDRFWAAVPLWIAAGIVFFASFLLASILKKIIIARITSSSKQSFNREIIILIERSIWFGTVLLGILVAFSIVGINIASLLGFLGLGLGFAFKDLLANFIAGVVILTQKKFLIGDKISVDGKTGTIVEIETRTTQVESLDGTLYVIPNADMLTSVVQNYTKNSFRRISFEVGVHYETPLEDSVRLTIESIKKHEEVIEKPPVQVLVQEFGDSAIKLEGRFWIESTRPWPRIRSEILQQLKKDYDGAGINIPYPITTLTIDEYDKNVLQAFHLPTKKNEDRPFAKKASGMAQPQMQPQAPDNNNDIETQHKSEEGGN